MIHAERIKQLNGIERRQGDYVVYWMQASRRCECNHALEYAIERANELELPVVVFFALTTHYPEANERHYAFLLEGLVETAQDLRQRNIALVVYLQTPQRAILKFAQRAALVVTDCGYMRNQANWRAMLAKDALCPVYQVETDVIVPVEVASGKEEYSAATFRRRIKKHLDTYLVPLSERKVEKSSLDLDLESLDLEHWEALLGDIAVDRSVKRQVKFIGGTKRARATLKTFINDKLPKYHLDRNEPVKEIRSNLSPYLHFGHISPLEVALEIRRSEGPQEAKNAFLEELIVRRELSFNFVHYNRRYDEIDCLPEWSLKTLGDHRGDERPHLYELEALEACQTEDIYWNAAQKEIMKTGLMSNYMRMYWGKKLIEWSPTPEVALERAIFLNNKYGLDGRDPNSYAGIAWCFGKHDRPWQERKIFGKVRYMNAAGLKRKFDIAAYVERVEALD